MLQLDRGFRNRQVPLESSTVGPGDSRYPRKDMMAQELVGATLQSAKPALGGIEEMPQSKGGVQWRSKALVRKDGKAPRSIREPVLTFWKLGSRTGPRRVCSRRRSATSTRWGDRRWWHLTRWRKVRETHRGESRQLSSSMGDSGNLACGRSSLSAARPSRITTSGKASMSESEVRKFTTQIRSVNRPWMMALER